MKLAIVIPLTDDPHNQRLDMLYDLANLQETNLEMGKPISGLIVRKEAKSYGV
mgnify:CR=1 FL=1